MPQPRPYRFDDLPHLLDLLGRINAASGLLCDFHPGDLSHHLTNILRGADPAVYFHVLDAPDGEPLGFVELSKWGAFDVVVHPDHRGGALERDTLAWAAAAQSAMRARVEKPFEHLHAYGMDIDPMRSRLLMELGFAPDPASYMALTIRPLAADDPLPRLPDGFSIRPADGVHEAAALAAVHSSAFHSNWTPERYATVMQTPGFVIDRELVVVAPTGEFAAFLVYWLDPVSRSGLFEPVGCAEPYQRRGLTTALMTHTFGLMRAAGMTHAVVKHELDNPASTRAYASLGFVRQAAYTEYKRAIAV